MAHQMRKIVKNSEFQKQSVSPMRVLPTLRDQKVVAIGVEMKYVGRVCRKV